MSDASCPLCFKLVRGSLEKHFNEQHAEIECPFCNIIYENQQLLNEHLINLHNEKSVELKTKDELTCPMCSSNFKTAKELENHVETHFEQKKDSSIICLDEDKLENGN